MDKHIEIYCENTQQKHCIPTSSTLTTLAKMVDIQTPTPILGAYVNNELKELAFELYKPKKVRFIDISNVDGHRMYVRSLIFVLQKALFDVEPSATLKIQHSVSNGLYAEIDRADIQITPSLVARVKARMQELVSQNHPFVSQRILTSDAVDLFAIQGHTDKAELFSQRKQLYTTIYQLDNLQDYFYGYLVPATSYLTCYDLVSYFEGMLLRYPKITNPTQLPELTNQDKMFDIVREHKNWLEILGVSHIGSINEIVKQRGDGMLIKVSEALHEKKVATIADTIKRESDRIRIILISGPSSSGKTSFTKRLEVQLMVAGLRPVAISLDNYFVDREKTPLDEHGEYNFEALEAIDIHTFNQHLLQLLNGEEVALPTFDFKLGRQKYMGNTLQISSDQIILIEGIHGLNPGLVPDIDRQKTFKIYVSALTQVNMDLHNRIPTTDHRLIRRIVRDYKYRKYSALDTLKRWPSVRKGEDQNIFPFQEEADVMFNSSLLYELSVLKQEAEPLLREVPQTVVEYAEAKRLLKFLEYFTPVNKNEIPPTSLLREFIGGSSFNY